MRVYNTISMFFSSMKPSYLSMRRPYNVYFTSRIHIDLLTSLNGGTILVIIKVTNDLSGKNDRKGGKAFTNQLASTGFAVPQILLRST